MRSTKDVITNMGYKNKSNLDTEFGKSLQNPYFKELVTKLNLPKEEVLKYTTSLEESALEYENCKNCKNILSCKNKVPGYCFLPSLKEGLIFAYTPCKYQKKVLEDKKITDNIYLFNAPSEIKNAKMKDILLDDPKRVPIIKWLNNFIEKPGKKGLYLHGSFGCGKTYLIAAMFNELAKQNIKSAVIFWPDFLQELKMSFNTSDFKNSMEQVKKVRLLLIDDVGAENVTPWVRDDILCPILQYRMQEGLPTFFTSNMTKKELESHLSITRDSVDSLKSKRILERINQLTDDIELISANLRK